MASWNKSSFNELVFSINTNYYLVVFFIQIMFCSTVIESSHTKYLNKLAFHF